MKKTLAVLCGLMLLLTLPTGCATEKTDGSEEPDPAVGNLIVVGFSQVGAESEWRVANSESMKNA
jgi:simple sugar transport system substrate-binding protein